MAHMARIKKTVMSALALGIIAASAARAEGMSVGGSLYWSGDFGGGATFTGQSADLLLHDTYVTPVYGFGISPFFDARYVEASVGLFFGGGRWERIRDGKPVGHNSSTNDFEHDASITSLNIEALGKYPIAFSGRDNMRIFPLLGAAYHIVVAGKGGVASSGGTVSTVITFDGTGELPKAIDLSALWFKFGCGLDYDLNEKLYLRGSFLYGVRLPNSYETNIVINKKDDFRRDGETRLGHGLTIKAGVGYNL